jgi:cell division protein FtsB
MSKILTYLKEKSKSKPFVIGAATLIAIICFVLFSNYGILKRINLEIEKTTIKKNITQERNIRDSLYKEIGQLKNNKTKIERIAREKYGMIKPGEKVYIFDKGKDSPNK